MCLSATPEVLDFGFCGGNPVWLLVSLCQKDETNTLSPYSSNGGMGIGVDGTTGGGVEESKI